MAADDTQLLGTELELVAAFDLAPLVLAFGAGTMTLRDSIDDGLRTVWLDLVPSTNGLDEALRRWIALVEALTPEQRSLWNACADRCLNTGIQSGHRPHATYLAIGEATLEATGTIGVRLVFTVYAVPAD